METPMFAMNIAPTSTALFCLTAEMTPSRTPKKVAKIIANRVSSSVVGSRSARMSVTGRPVWIDVPKSPCARLPT